MKSPKIVWFKNFELSFYKKTSLIRDSGQFLLPLSFIEKESAYF